jgi:hypothetical protein
MISRPIVSGFIRIVRKHWETSSLRKAVANHSLNVSEEMLLGLGGTASITFWYAMNDVSPFGAGGYGKAFKLNQAGAHFRHFGLNLLRFADEY